MDDDAQEEIRLIASFLSKQCGGSDLLSVRNLSSGRGLAELLHHTSAPSFDAEWLATLKTADGSANKHVKSSNLKKLYNELSDYYDRRGVGIQDDWRVQVNSIAESDDPQELRRLLRLVLGVIFLGEQNRGVIAAANGEPHNVQSAIATGLKELHPFFQAAGIVQDTSSTKDDDDVAELSNDASWQQLEELRQQSSANAAISEQYESKIAELSSNCHRLEVELDETQIKLEKAEAVVARIKIVEEENWKMKDESDGIKDELYTVKAERDRLRARVEQRDREVAELMEKMSNLTDFTEQFKRVSEELDKARLRLSDVNRLEQMVEVLKTRLKESQTEQSEIRLLRGKCDAFMQSHIELEDEKRTCDSLRQQLGAVKALADERFEALEAMSKRADKEEFKFKQAMDRIAELEDHMRRSNARTPQLDDSNEANSSLAHQLGYISPGRADDLRDEVRLLKQRNQELETECRLATLKANEATNQCTVLEKQLQESTDDSSRQQETLRLRADVERARISEQEVKAKLDDTRSRLDRADEDLQTTRANVSRLEDYLHRAHRVIVNLEREVADRGGPNGGSEALQKAVEERDARINMLMTQSERAAAMHEQETRLITTAFYQCTSPHVEALLLGDKGVSSSMSTSTGSSASTLLARQKPPPPSVVYRLGRVVFHVVALGVCWLGVRETLFPHFHALLPPLRHH